MNKLKMLFNKGRRQVRSFVESGWRHLSWGLLVYLAIYVSIMGFFFLTGAGKWFDIFFTVGTGTIAFISGTAVTFLLLKVLEGIPKRLAAFIIGSICVVYSVGTFLGPFFRYMGFAIIILGALTGLTLFLYKKAGKSLFLSFTVITISAHVFFFYLVVTEGDEGPWSVKTTSSQEADMANPIAEGEYDFQHFTYGSGNDKRREEYQEVYVQTSSVNMSPFVVHPKGYNKWYRNWFWGFDLHQAPLNGRIWMPKRTGEESFPLVLIVHGNHNMADFSDGGYAYLGEMLASKGYIAVSVDQNFINSGKTGHIGWDNAGRAWLLLKHMEQWQKWNNDREHPFHNLVDMDNIALIGHSRGGEAISIAALFNNLDRFPNNAKIKFDFDFSIKSLIGLSPGDGRFKPGDQLVELEDINYLTLQGGNDTDHTNYLGMRQYERVRFSESFEGFKSSVYIYGGNHGQFNSDWEVDQPSPYWWFMNRKELMNPVLQREITKYYIASFLDATLKDKQEYRTVFADKESVSAWIPAESVRIKFEESNFLPVATYEEDVDVTSTSIEAGSALGVNLHVWKEMDLLLRNKETQNNQVVELGWKSRNSRYTLRLPAEASQKFTKNTILAFDAVQAHESRYDFYGIPIPDGYKNLSIPITVSIKPKGAMKLDSRIRQTIFIEPTYTTTLYRFDWWNNQYGNDYEHMLQTYMVPLNFLEENFPSMDYTKIEEITFEFNQTESGLLLLDNVGFYP